MEFSWPLISTGTHPPCVRCGHDFPDLQGLPPKIQIYIIQQHAKYCVGSVVPNYDPNVVQFNRGDFPSTRVPISGISPESLASTTPERKKYETDMTMRKAQLEADVWGTQVTSKSVVCKGCGKRIRLDQRNEYYPGLWIKHRDNCKVIQIHVGYGQPPRGTSRSSVKRAPTPGESDVSVVRIGRVTKPHARKAVAKTVTPSRILQEPPRKIFQQVRRRAMSTFRGNRQTETPEKGIEPRRSLRIHSLASNARTPTTPHQYKESDNSVPAVPDTQMQPNAQSMIRKVPSSQSISSRSEDAPPVYSDSFISSDGTYVYPPSTSVKTPGHRNGYAFRKQYWSEAPFATDSGESGPSLYRYSTRRELLRVFPSLQN